MRKALRSLPSLDFLKGFEAAGRLLSFTRAAEELFVTQSALSRQVQALEEALGAPLFVRRHRALSLTPAGAAFHRDIVAALNAIAGAAEAARGAVRAPGVTLSTTVSFASLWVIPRLANFRERHPDAEVYISADDRLVDLARGEVDVAVRYLPDAKAPEGAIRLFGERMMPVVSPKLVRRRGTPLAGRAGTSAAHRRAPARRPARRAVSAALRLGAWLLRDHGAQRRRSRRRRRLRRLAARRGGARTRAARGTDSTAQEGDVTGSSPSPWVVRFSPLVAAGARVLDLACGQGRHARWFAGRGCRVLAVDRDVAALAALAGVPGVATAALDLESGRWPLAGERFDAIVVTNYLHRPLLPHLLAAMADDGVLIYETFAHGNEAFGRPSNPAFLLEPAELLRFVEGRLFVIAFEEGQVDADRGAAVVQRIAAVGTRRRAPPIPPAGGRMR
jgi:DNA-binding transcriptional LysR family regulator